MEPSFTQRGFLPEHDPLTAFPPDSPLAALDELGRDLPSLLIDSSFREYARRLDIPPWTPPDDPQQALRNCGCTTCGWAFSPRPTSTRSASRRRRCCRGTSPCRSCRACRCSSRPPILSYDGYALYNWKRFDPPGRSRWATSTRCRTSSISTTSTGSSWSTSRSRRSPREMLAAIERIEQALPAGDARPSIAALAAIARAVWRQVAVLRRIPEKMDPAVYLQARSAPTSASSRTSSTKGSSRAARLPGRNRRAEQHHADAGRAA